MVYDMILYRIPILGGGVFYQMVYTACLPVCGISVADTLVRGTPVLGVAGVLPGMVGRGI